MQQFRIVTIRASDLNSTVAAELLRSEIRKRTALDIPESIAVPSSGDLFILKTALGKIPGLDLPATTPVMLKPEAFRIMHLQRQGRELIVVEGADARGVLYGVGWLLRHFLYGQSSLAFTEWPSIVSSPDKAIRGHQLGYRNTANSYDGWTKEQFEQYIRDLVVFGANSIESIPIFDESGSPHFKVPPMEMNSFISSVCQKYVLDYWMWIPAQFDLSDTTKRNRYLETFRKICQQSARIDGVFFPGGDPGDNSPELVMPLLKDLSVILKRYHPAAKTWLSLQGFSEEQCRYTYKYIREQMPAWLGGLITGPSSPTAKQTRPELPAKYMIRHYPDLTHNVRCEFEIPWWDPAFSLTLGREAVNPRPAHYTAIYHSMEAYINGFISYSDGVHDDVNKIIWTMLAWNSSAQETEILQQYSNYFFETSASSTAADGILALEKNWQGPIATNGGITATLAYWKNLEQHHPLLAGNWRWQMCLLRAHYDAYTRARQAYESELEQQANDRLLHASLSGAEEAMKGAEAVLEKAVAEPVDQVTRSRIIELCEALYQSIQLQTSVAKYKASGLERGAVLDFLDRPLNNRWWLQDQFARIRALPSAQQLKELQTIADWERVSAGSFYDEVGNIGKSPHELKGESWTFDPQLQVSLNPGYDFSDNGMSRKRLSWLTNMRWPIGLQYNDIDSTATYTIRINGTGECLLKVNGQRVAPSRYGREAGVVKEFPVPQELVRSGRLLLTFDDINEDFLNWRQQSRIHEVWLIKSDPAR